jgi:hypothetical protein
MSKRTCDTGLDHRCRDLDGEIRQKRGDTLVRTLRKTYGPDFAPGVRSEHAPRHAPRTCRWLAVQNYKKQMMGERPWPTTGLIASVCS